MKKIRYLIGLTIAAIFLIQATGLIILIPLELTFDFFGQSQDLIITAGILFLIIIAIQVIEKLASEAVKRNFSTSVFDESYHYLSTAFIRTFIALWAAIFTYAYFGGELSIELIKTTEFLNYYLVWFVLAITFIEPVKINYNERTQFQNQMTALQEKAKNKELNVQEFISEQQKIGKKLLKKRRSE